MLIHSTLSRSRVNGPGERAVIWFQGCSLRCKGCFNPTTHPFDQSFDRSIEEIGAWVIAQAGIEGVTFSGGEPFQQAFDLLALSQYIRSRAPALSIGLFSGYAVSELESGQWKTWTHRRESFVTGHPSLYESIKAHLDFGIFGRFQQARVTTAKPLCGSANQKVLFFTGRYAARELEPDGFELTIDPTGESILTGFPPSAGREFGEPPSLLG